jgi:hypothetical protein
LWASARFRHYLKSRLTKISRRILSGDQGMIVWWSIGAAPSCPLAHKLVDEKGHPLAPVVNLTVSTPKLKDKTPKLTHDGAKKGQSVQ